MIEEIITGSASVFPFYNMVIAENIKRGKMELDTIPKHLIDFSAQMNHG